MKTAIEIIHTLNSNGYEGYIVGGFGRDLLLSKPSSDIDIATNATPEEVTKLFGGENWKVIPTGVEHGTVTLMHRHFNSTVGYELTTYRKDISGDGRNATIEFATSIEDDLTRRDFTMNAIAYNPITEEYIDPFSGKYDIQHKVIECVGDANTRFVEDHLRMLRALRFYSTLGDDWIIEEGTYNAIKKKAYLIERISKERIKSEIDKCFEKSDNPAKMFYQMRETGLMKFILPELDACYGFAQNKYHKYDVFNHTLKALNAVSKEYPLIRWAALFHDLGKPESCEHYGEPHASFHGHEVISERIATKVMKRLRFSADDIKYINNLIKHHMFVCSREMKDSAIRRFVAKIGVEYVDDICILKYADRVGNGTKPSGELNIEGTGLKRRATKILEEVNAFKVTDLIVDGKDVMEVLSIKPSPLIGDILKALLEEVLDDPSLNNREYLLSRIKEK